MLKRRTNPKIKDISKQKDISKKYIKITTTLKERTF